MPDTKKSQLLIWSMLLTCAIFYGYEFLLRVSPSIMVSELMLKHNISASEVGLLSAFYYFAYTPLQLVAGTLIDHYGAKLLLTICVLTCVIGTYLFGMTDSLMLAKLGRASIGFGSAFAFVGVLRICSDWFPSRMFAVLTGITTTLGMLGAISGEALLESAKVDFGLNNIFIACIVFGVMLTILVWLLVDSKKMFNIHKNKLTEFKSLINHMVFLLKKPIFWHIALIGLCLFMPTTIFASLWAVKFLGDVFNVKHAANFSSLIFLGWAVGSPIVGIIKSKQILSDKKQLVFGSLMAFIAVFVLLYLPGIAKDNLTIIMFAFGFFSSVEILAFDLNHIISGPALCGTAVALTNMVVMLGGFVQPFVGYLLDAGSNKIGIYSLQDYQLALCIIPISFLISFLLSLLLKTDRIMPTSEIPD